MITPPKGSMAGKGGELALRDSQVVVRVLALIARRLFAAPAWLPDDETRGELNEELIRLGLQRPCPDAEGCEEVTARGKQLNLELLMVFFGLWVEWHIPMVLEDQGYISSEECDEIMDEFERGVPTEQLLNRHVVEAYFKLYEVSRLDH